MLRVASASSDRRLQTRRRLLAQCLRNSCAPCKHRNKPCDALATVVNDYKEQKHATVRRTVGRLRGLLDRDGTRQSAVGHHRYQRRRQSKTDSGSLAASVAASRANTLAPRRNSKLA